jgi:hypothetical protein
VIGVLFWALMATTYAHPPIIGGFSAQLHAVLATLRAEKNISPPDNLPLA